MLLAHTEEGEGKIHRRKGNDSEKAAQAGEHLPPAGDGAAAGEEGEKRSSEREKGKAENADGVNGLVFVAGEHPEKPVDQKGKACKENENERKQIEPCGDGTTGVGFACLGGIQPPTKKICCEKNADGKRGTKQCKDGKICGGSKVKKQRRSQNRCTQDAAQQDKPAAEDGNNCALAVIFLHRRPPGRRRENAHQGKGDDNHRKGNDGAGGRQPRGEGENESESQTD